MENYGQGSPLKNLRKTASIFMLAVAGIVFPAIVFIGCDNDTTSGSNNNNNNNQNEALNIATLTTWLNYPARTVSAGVGGGANSLGAADIAAIIAKAPGFWGSTYAVYKNDHATYVRLVTAYAKSLGLPNPIVVTQGKRFDASAIAVKNLLESI